jgi:hypothetical protein
LELVGRYWHPEFLAAGSPEMKASFAKSALAVQS